MNTLKQNYQVILYVILNNIDVLVQTGQYGAIDKTDATTMGYYFIKFLSQAYTLQEELSVQSHYMKYMQDNINVYQEQTQ